MRPKVEAAVASIASVMSGVTYPYQLIVVSYASPTPDAMRYADWQYGSKLWTAARSTTRMRPGGYRTATPALDAGVRVAAASVNVRFLDLLRAFDGHEWCASGVGASQQWVRGVTYDSNSNDWYTAHALQQSLHSNAVGHSKTAGCVAEFAAVG
jgi:hypothetical protein